MNNAFRVSVFLGGMVIGSFYHELTNDNHIAPRDQGKYQEVTVLEGDQKGQLRYYGRDTLTRQDKHYIPFFED